MAELVDATDSKSVVRKDVQVRFLFWAQKNLKVKPEVFLLPVCGFAQYKINTLFEYLFQNFEFPINFFINF